MDSFRFIFIFTVGLGLTIMTAHNHPIATTSHQDPLPDLKNHYKHIISKELGHIMDTTCKNSLNDKFTITIGTTTISRNERGFSKLELTSYDPSHVVPSIYRQAKQMQQISPVETTIILLEQNCNNTIQSEVTTKKIHNHQKTTDNSNLEKMCHEVLALKELWRIFTAHPKLRYFHCA